MVVSQSEAASAGSGEVQESERDASLETPAKSETDGPEEGGLLQSDNERARADRQAPGRACEVLAYFKAKSAAYLYHLI